MASGKIEGFEVPRKNNRPSWDEYFLQISDLVSTRATCQRLKVGAILVKDKKIISTGYCGAPKKVPDCFEVGCFMKDGHCVRTIHAEINAVTQAAFHGITTSGATVYANWLPCYNCAKVLINAGVERLVYRREYRPDPDTRKLLKQAKIKLLKVDGKEK
ncbi:cytidine/deoxycytidylate deaminase family protein [Candidatus Daviesbacteria bacterium]|nr:cytidine/deoxycytidylate deaminase family protein [Candidatus Daviesbacteria bacterium]